MKFVAALALAATTMVPAFAGTITFASSTSTANDSVSPTQVITKNPSWFGPLPGSDWISYTNSGDPTLPGYVQVPNDAPGAGVTFTQTFTLTGNEIVDVGLTVLADDTASVVLNGFTLMAASTGPNFATCSEVPIGCLELTKGEFTFADLQPHLILGENTLAFTGRQANSSSYGLDYAGFATTATPEPASMALIGSDLVGVAVLSRRRKQSQAA